MYKVLGGLEGEMVRAAELAACCTYLKKKKKKRCLLQQKDLKKY